MNPDTRVALVREDTASKRVKKALLSAKEDAFLSIDAQVDAILAELFPETNKPLRVVDIRNAIRTLQGATYYLSAQNIEEELNRG